MMYTSIMPMLLMGFIVSIHLLWWGSGLTSGNPEEGSQTSIERSIFEKSHESRISERLGNRSYRYCGNDPTKKPSLAWQYGVLVPHETGATGWCTCHSSIDAAGIFPVVQVRR